MRLVFTAIISLTILLNFPVHAAPWTTIESCQESYASKAKSERGVRTLYWACKKKYGHKDCSVVAEWRSSDPALSSLSDELIIQDMWKKMSAYEPDAFKDKTYKDFHNTAMNAIDDSCVKQDEKYKKRASCYLNKKNKIIDANTDLGVSVITKECLE